MPATKTARILIVDDDQGLLRLLQKTLEREGFATACATSGREAKEWLAHNRADLMLLDRPREHDLGLYALVAGFFVLVCYFLYALLGYLLSQEFRP